MTTQNKILFYGITISLLIVLQIAPMFIYDYYGTIPRGILSEDGFYEYFAAFCLGIASCVFFYVYIKFDKKNYIALFAAIVIFILCAEEISWGQRIFDIQTPDALKSLNYQEEISLHNLKIIQSSNNSLSDLAVKLLVLYFLISPFLKYIPKVNLLITKYNIPIASFYIAVTLVILRFLNKYDYFYIYGEFNNTDIFSLGEAYEGNIEILLLVLAIEYLFTMKHKCCHNTLNFHKKVK